MATITIVRQQAGEISDADREAVRRVVFGYLDGLGERGKRQWRRLWNQMLRLEPGETLDIQTHKARIGWFHRKHMALEAKVFEAQERFEGFEAFRAWTKVGAGFVEWFPGPKGGVIPVPKSISYSELEQHDMEDFHEAAVSFLRQPHAIKTLWPHLPPARGSEMLEAVLGGFGE